MKKAITCINCGKPFTVSRKSRFDVAKFCSRKCKHQYSQVTLECEYCGKTFQRTKGIVKSRKAVHVFCSLGCRFKYNKINGSWNKEMNLDEVACDQCGKKIIKPHSVLKQYNNHFCSKKCYDRWKVKNLRGKSNPNWIGGHEHYRGENWFEQRREALKRDDFTCQKCGLKDIPLDVHHIIPFRYFGNDRYKEANQLENLLTCCRPCHGDAEFESRKMMEEMIICPSVPYVRVLLV